MRNLVLRIFLFLFTSTTFSQANRVAVISNAKGMKLVVDGKDFIIKGMNWDYYPIGTNYAYNLWEQSDEVVKEALDAEMGLLKKMGVNAIRQYTGVPPKWIKYIYDTYGIYTMLNHSFGRYGLTIDGSWVANTEYADPKTYKILVSEVKTMVSEYKDTPGLLLFLLGNENNYGLFWGGAETENIPIEDQKSTIRAQGLYKAFNEAIIEMKKIDTNHPMAICNGDLQFLDIIKKECTAIDILGANVYRGLSFGDFFEKVKKEINKPVVLTEFGADAFNAISNKEDQRAQAYYLLGNWKEIYENAYGLGKAGNSIGGFTFQFSDGWWKFGQTFNLNIHDTNASWGNGGYAIDMKDKRNNMNEEWFGICTKGPTNSRGLYSLSPRAAYYLLQEVHKINPLLMKSRKGGIDHVFSAISIDKALVRAKGE